MWSSKTDQWWFKLWKLIKDLNLEHLKSPCSIYLMWLFFDLKGKENKIFRAQLPVSNVWNNHPLFVRKKEIIAPGYYLRKYVFELQDEEMIAEEIITVKYTTYEVTSFRYFFRVFSQLHKLHTKLWWSSLHLWINITLSKHPALIRILPIWG